MTDIPQGGPNLPGGDKPTESESGPPTGAPEHPDGTFAKGERQEGRDVEDHLAETAFTAEAQEGVRGGDNASEEEELDPELEDQLIEALRPLNTARTNIQRSNLPDEVKNKRISRINEEHSALERRIKEEWLTKGELRERLSDFVADGLLPLLAGKEGEEGPDVLTTIMELTPVKEGGYRVGGLQDIFPNIVVKAVLEEMYIMAGTTAPPNNQETHELEEGEKRVVRTVVPGTMEGLWMAEERIYPKSDEQQELAKLERIRIVAEFKK